MKTILLLAAVGLSMWTTSALAQDCCEELRQQVRATPTLSNLAKLGREGDKSDIDLLKSVLQMKLSPMVRSQAKAALSKLGDIASFLDISADCYEGDGVKQGECFKAFEYIGGANAICVLDDRLNDTVQPKADGDMGFPAPAVWAVWDLVRLVPDGPKVKLWDARGAIEQRKAWKTYLFKHPEIADMGRKPDWVAALSVAVASENNRAVLVIGRLANRSLIPTARALSASSASGSRTQLALSLLLARLGDQVEFEKIAALLDSDDSYAQDEAVNALVYVGGSKAIGSLTQLLDRSSPRKAPPLQSGQHSVPGFAPTLPPLNVIAMQGLAHLLPEYPVWATTENSSASVTSWKIWLKFYKEE